MIYNDNRYAYKFTYYSLLDLQQKMLPVGIVIQVPTPFQKSNKDLFKTDLRIDNSGRSVIYTFGHKSETVLVIITCNIPNKRSFDTSAITIIFALRVL